MRIQLNLFVNVVKLKLNIMKFNIDRRLLSENIFRASHFCPIFFSTKGFHYCLCLRASENVCTLLAISYVSY